MTDVRRLRELTEQAPSLKAGRTPWRFSFEHEQSRHVIWTDGSVETYVARTSFEDIVGKDASLIVAAVNSLPALLDCVDAARKLLNDLDDAIAGADLEAWDAPYRIEAPLFRESADFLRAALSAVRDTQ